MLNDKKRISNSGVGLLSGLLFLLSVYFYRGNRGSRRFLPESIESDLEVYEVYEPKTDSIAIIQFFDSEYIIKFAPQIQSVACYADAHGYGHHIVDPSDYLECNRMDGDFFHKQLCALNIHMEHHPEIDYFLKLDGDVIAGTSEHGLEHWLKDGADIIVQERFYTAEYNAGCWIVKNTEPGRNFVKSWSQFWWKDGFVGYNGNDNGTLHLALLDILHVNNREECWNMWRSGLDGTLDSYFEFVACTRNLMGPARRHHHQFSNHVIKDVKVTVWPAMFGPMMDISFAGEIGPNRLYYPFHHGIKQLTDPTIIGYYGENLGDVSMNQGHCVRWSDRATQEIWSFLHEKALGFSEPLEPISIDELGNVKCFKYNGPFYHNRVPRWSITGLNGDAEDGYFSCEPLGPTQVYLGEGTRCTGPMPTDGKISPAEIELIREPVSLVEYGKEFHRSELLEVSARSLVEVE